MTSQRPTTSLFTLAAGLAVALSFALLSGCGPKYPNCDNDDHCRGYDRGVNFCVDGICRGCRDDSHCREGTQCSGNQCVAIPGYCRGEADCPSPQKCRNNRCGAECLGDGECGENEECENGRCVEAPECRADGDCGAGMECRSGSCVQAQVAVDRGPCPDRILQRIHFDFDESRLRSDAIAILEENLECLNRYDSDSIVIEGHCDERGTEEYNLALGERRARAARNWFRDNGISRSRMTTRSRGEYDPIARGHNERAWAQNRRDEFIWSN